ncbi:uncharacterized protein UV8b_07947 [Ustilaginoidea virens]|uniref:Telomere-associated protein Rif1 N-terminal domain-containing protein n=1 Tax=Ustilaginoidea virens TaxID=1159556 RepID=A0A8E5MLA1_USTVR|nr:uncharacterized protein UV8b_07947 [Ustilaginoidea virens]QUC23706.1 hypothetical protein UV8b_07947 [Ustilaginoidea virens]
MASSAASAPSTNILESLPARPPTPPREAPDRVDIAPKSVAHRNLAFDPELSLQTPPNVNSLTTPVATSSNPNSSRTRKKVEWSAHTEYREAPFYHNSLKLNKSSPPLPAPSSATSKPVKSILKPTSSPNPLTSSVTNQLNGPILPVNIIEMLDSTIKQLAGSDRDSKLDAYMMLSRALKASNNLPDRVALQGKMSLFMQFIQRDITTRAGNGSLDSSLINHSLTLLATFLHFPAIAATLTVDFGIFIIDHSVRSFEDEKLPKDVIRHLMQVVAFQDFSPKVMTFDRVGRLVNSLHRIEKHLKGKSIILSRLHIYKRLVKQSRTHMAAHSDWLKDLFTDLLSSVRDIRTQAITLGTEAGFALRSQKNVLRKVTDIFQACDDNEAYIDFYIKRLQGMLKEKQSSSAVPQIWRVVILFLRCPLDRWQYYGPWMTLVQSAFNMTDNLTKQEANFAWNHYVYMSVSDAKLSPKAIGTLCQPLLSQLRRKSNPKQQDEAIKLRNIVIGGICNLYYYAFAPGNGKYTPDMLWEVTVQPVISQLAELDHRSDTLGDEIMQAARLLVGLLDATTPRIWRQDRIMEMPPVKSDELPGIDSKWTRKNCDKVLDSVGPIVLQKFYDLANKDSLVYRLWQALIHSVMVASAKDIKVSDDTTKFVGCALRLLANALTTEASRSNASNAKFLSSISNFIQLLVNGLGILPFTEKKLSMAIPNTSEPASTPLQKPYPAEKPRELVRMPLHHLHVLEAARSKLWGAPPMLCKGGLTEPMDSLYKVGNHFLNWLYNNCGENPDKIATAMSLLKSIDRFTEQNMAQFGLIPVTKLESGLSVWIEDKNAHLASVHKSVLLQTTITLWDRVCCHIAKQGRLEKQDRDQITLLLEAGFKSTQAIILQRTAALWNVIVNDEEDAAGYANSLLSIISSIQSKGDALLPLDFTAHSEYGAPCLNPLQKESALINPPLASITENASESSQSPVTTMPRRAVTRRTPELITSSAKRASTPRLRHNNSQIQFEPIISSSPPQDDSQHLTERQKEVRERQRETTALFSEGQTTPQGDSDSLPGPGKERINPSESSEQIQESTPKRSKSFEDAITSTPTPRRGEVIQMDDFNDPPSSPLLPRPYPLLSEIQSRSRAGGAMESWEFSSPPGSPTGHQQPEYADLPKHAETVTANRNQATTSAPVVGVTTRARRALQRAGMEEQVSAEARSAERRSGRRAEAKVKRDDETDSNLRSTSGVEKFIKQETTDAALPLQSTSRPIKRHACNKVYDDSTVSPEKPETAPRQISSQVVPSTPIEPPHSIASSVPRRKRKRGARNGGNRIKRRRSVEIDVQESPTPATPGFQNERAGGVETRSGLRRRQEQAAVDERKIRRKESERQSVDLCINLDSGDTDDEVVSQLVTESNAASQSMSDKAEAIDTELSAASKSEAQLKLAEDNIRSAPNEEEKMSIIETLRNDLEQMRGLSLTRAEVYQVEDILMDMKRELFEAERRGRRERGSGRSRKRKLRDE